MRLDKFLSEASLFTPCSRTVGIVNEANELDIWYIY